MEEAGLGRSARLEVTRRGWGGRRGKGRDGLARRRGSAWLGMRWVD